MNVSNLPETEHAVSPYRPESSSQSADHPKTFRFRCYVYGDSKNHFVAECIDLDIAVEETSLKRAVRSLNDAVDGYVSVACTGDLHGLIPRRSPLSRRFMYHYRALQYKIMKRLWPDGQQGRLETFDVKESLCF